MSAADPYAPPAPVAAVARAAAAEDFVISEADFLAAQWLHLRPRPFFRIAGIIILGLMGLSLAITIGTGNRDAAPIIAGLAWPALFVLLWRRKMRQLYRAMPFLALPTRVSIADDRLVIDNDWFTARFPLDAIRKVKRRGNLALISFGGPLFHIVKTDHPRVAELVDGLTPAG